VIVVSVTGWVVVGALVDVEDVGLVTLDAVVVAVCSGVVTVTLACGCTAGTVVEGKSSSSDGVWFGGEPPHATTSGSNRANAIVATFRGLCITGLRLHLSSVTCCHSFPPKRQNPGPEPGVLPLIQFLNS